MCLRWHLPLPCGEFGLKLRLCFFARVLLCRLDVDWVCAQLRLKRLPLRRELLGHAREPFALEELHPLA
jgi:hypothetical protein